MTTRSPLVLTAVALTAVVVAGCRETRVAPDAVVIVTLDTTRADHLSIYGRGDVSQPGLERLASNGVVFDQAISVSPLTLPAHASLFTGLLPGAHGVRDNGDPALSGEHVTLATALKARGFRTGAFVASVVLDADRGLAQGFEHYSAVRPDAGSGRPRMQRRADEVMDEAIAWLDHVGGEPYLLWVHLYDPHRPYDPPPPFAATADPYLGEIAFVDAQIGRLLDALDARRLTDRTVVIAVADHGEARGEHNERDHGIFLYEGVVRVPFIMRVPGVAARRVGDVVRSVDVAPTVLDLLGMPPLTAAGGVSLAAVLRGDERLPDLEAYAESSYPRRFGWSPLYALRDDRFKFIHGPNPELYDLLRDPAERHNIVEDRRSVAAAMRQRLSSLRPEVSARRTAVIPAALSERLAALGYVSGSADDLPHLQTAPDPRFCIGGTRLAAVATPPAPGCPTPR